MLFRYVVRWIPMGTATAGKITLLFGTLSFVYGAAEFRSVKRRAKRPSRK